MTKALALVPATGAFGPLMMVIGLDSPYRLVSILGAAMTSAAILLLFVAMRRPARD